MKILKSLTLLLFIFLVFISCKKEEEAVTPNVGNVADNEIDATKMLELVNNLRATGCTCGNTEMPSTTALVWNIDLEEAAYLHSKDMNDNDYFSHTSQDGRSFTERMKAAGYDIQGASGENIARGQRSEEQVFESWKNSEGHCKNMMNSSFNEFGAGRSANLWTQVFSSNPNL